MRLGHTLLGVALLVVGMAGLASCTDRDPSAPEPRVTAVEFDGTPEEYTTLTRACLEEHGFRTGKIPGSRSSVGYTVDLSESTYDDFRTASEDCAIVIGEPPMTALSEAELRVRYGARIDQWDCLVDRGLISGEPVSFETFIDRYRRSNETELWEPTDGAASAEGSSAVGPSDVCPRADSVW